MEVNPIHLLLSLVAQALCISLPPASTDPGLLDHHGTCFWWLLGHGGSGQRKESVSRSAFPRANTMCELALLEPRDQLSTSVCACVRMYTCVRVHVVDRCQEPTYNLRGSTSEYFSLPLHAILSTDLEVALNL